MCFTNPICIFYFLVSFSLIASFQNSLKTRIKLHKIAYNMSKNCDGVEWRKGGYVRIGRALWLLRDRRPWTVGLDHQRRIMIHFPHRWNPVKQVTLPIHLITLIIDALSTVNNFTFQTSLLSRWRVWNMSTFHATSLQKISGPAWQ